MEELELTYLARALPLRLAKSSHKEILDIYLPASAAHPTLRIRQNGDRFEITKKEPIKDDDASHQLETTIPLRVDEYKELVSSIKGKRVQKTRFYYSADGFDYEVDVFRGDLAGLVLIDMEFNSLDKKSTFVPPPWCLADITQEKFLAGGMLCGKHYRDIEKDLARFGYQKLTVDF